MTYLFFEINRAIANEDEYVTKIANIDGIRAGNYTVSEIDVSRYQFEKMDTIGGTADQKSVHFDLKDRSRGMVTFYNVCTRYDKVLHNDLKINKFRKQ